jgi:uncharacterized membrane protein
MEMFLKNTSAGRFYASRSEIEKILILSSAFSMVLVLIRVIMTGSELFLFLPWNLFLAFAPLFISTRLMSRPELVEQRWKFGLLFIAWLLLIPNSFYILTDLFHLKLRDDSNRWFDLTLIFSFAWNGLLMGILSVRQMEKIFVQCFHIRHEWFFLYPVMWLNALGIYIGRYLRFNSWDMITNPFQLLDDILYMVVHPLRNFYPWAMICCFAVFMTLLYLSVKRIAKVI